MKKIKRRGKGWEERTTLGYSRKNLHPHDGRHAGKSHGRGGGGVNGSGNPDGSVALNLKIHPWGYLSISSMFQSLQSISFPSIGSPSLLL